MISTDPLLYNFTKLNGMRVFVISHEQLVVLKLRNNKNRNQTNWFDYLLLVLSRHRRLDGEALIQNFLFCPEVVL